MATLHTTPISRAAARQRAGRAGRIQDSTCYRLYTKDFFDKTLMPNTPPGMLTSEVMAEVPILKSCGFHKISDLNFVDAPHVETVLRALQYVDADAKLTKNGSMAVGMPVDPAWYNSFLRPRSSAASSRLSPSRAARWCRMPFTNPKVAEQAQKMRNSMMASMSKRMLNNEPVPALEPSDPNFGLKIRQSLADGFYHKAAHMDRRGTYKTVHDSQPVLPEPDSCLVGEKYEWVICDRISFSGVQYMRYVTAIDPAWIMDPEHFQDRNLAYRFDGITLKNPHVKASLDRA